MGPPAKRAKRLGQLGRLDVDDPVSEALAGARAAVVDLVRMEHDDLPGHADARRASVVEDLNAAVGQADRVGVVTMLLVRLAGEPRAKQLDAIDRPRAGDPARGRPLARSFKTLAAGSGFLGAHAGDRVRPRSKSVRFLLFAVVAAVTPGPSNIMLTAAGANAGVLQGLPCLLGVASGMGLMMFLVPLGLGSVVLGHPVALKALNWGGAAFLLWLSWKIATSSPHRGDRRAARRSAIWGPRSFSGSTRSRGW